MQGGLKVWECGRGVSPNPWHSSPIKGNNPTARPPCAVLPVLSLCTDRGSVYIKILLLCGCYVD
jgi:hypothetical protein